MAVGVASRTAITPHHAGHASATARRWSPRPPRRRQARRGLLHRDRM